MRVLLTGATGFLGGTLLPALLRAGHDVCCLLRESSDSAPLAGATVRRFRDLGDLYPIMAEARPESVVHLAGLFLGEHSPDTIADLLASNVTFPAVLLDAADRAGCRQCVNTGSCWQTFGGDGYDPVNLYAATKQAAEDILAYYVKARHWRGITLRLFDTYGANDHRPKVLNLIRALRDGGSLGLSPGEQKLYLCHADDVARAYLAALALLPGMPPGTARVYSVRGDRPCSLRRIADAYQRLSGKRLDLRWGERPYRPREIMDPSGWGETLPNWRPELSLEDGLRRFIRDWRNDEHE